MSTYWGYVCVSHAPPLGSEQWFNHGEDALCDAYVRERAGTWPDEDNAGLYLPPDPVPVQVHGYGTTAPIWWLRQHPNCRVLVESEYGDLILPEDGTAIYGRVIRNARRPVRDEHGTATGEWEPVPWPTEGERLCGCGVPSSLLPDTLTPEPGYWHRCLCGGLREVPVTAA